MKRILLFAAALLAGLAQAATITDVRVSGAGPVTFGQVFAVGDLKKSDVLVGNLAGTTVPLQVDVKATHADGSIRHAIISAQIPKAGTMQLNTGGILAIPMMVDMGNPSSASVSATIAGVKYSATASGPSKTLWLAGPVVNEWQTVAPLTTAAGIAHPHLTARFAIRYYTASKKTRVDVTVENAWAFEPGPQNFTYDADISIGGKSVYSKAGLTHYHHARWRKVFWDGPTVQHNTKYLIASKAVPNYDQSVSIADSLLASFPSTIEPMNIGPATAYMPTTGAHSDIGILPNWGAAYVLSMDPRARAVTLAAGDGAGSFSVHYRDRKTDRPVALADHPRMTILGRTSDAGADAFPGCAADCATPFTADTSHQPSFAYLPYLLTGDYFYLEEMQFWGMWDAFNDNPNYRGFEKGLLSPGQVRGQAWSLRTLAEAAYITPDTDSLKDDFTKIIDNNLDWYNATYTVGGANKLGIITNGYAFSYNYETALAPWQDDHFTSAVGHAAELGFTKAEPLLKWKAKFQIGRMMDPGFCWIDASMYNVKLRDSSSSPIYGTLAEVYQKSANAQIAALKCNSLEQLALRRNAGEFASSVLNDIPGNANSPSGYVSNFQPALAMAVDSGYEGGSTAWKMFSTRAVRPDYSREPQFAIVPRETPTPPVVVPPAPVKVGKVTTGSNVKLAKQGPLTVVFIDPAKFSVVKSFAGVVATSKGAFTVSDALLIPGSTYLVIVGNAAGNPLDAFLLAVPK